MQNLSELYLWQAASSNFLFLWINLQDILSSRCCPLSTLTLCCKFFVRKFENPFAEGVFHLTYSHIVLSITLFCAQWTFADATIIVIGTVSKFVAIIRWSRLRAVGFQWIFWMCNARIVIIKAEYLREDWDSGCEGDANAGRGGGNRKGLRKFCTLALGWRGHPLLSYLTMIFPLH